LESLNIVSEIACFVLSEQVQGDPIEDGKVLCGVAGAFAVQIFSEADIEGPVELVFDSPVLANGPVELCGVGLETGDVVADFLLGFARCLVEPFGLDAHQTL
jgi:hypothetical protein